MRNFVIGKSNGATALHRVFVLFEKARKAEEKWTVSGLTFIVIAQVQGISVCPSIADHA